MARDVVVYIDEYGDPDLATEKNGPSTFFIVTAVIVDAAEHAGVVTAAEEVRRRFFQTGEMKSSRVASNDARRIEVLKAINCLNLRSYTLLVDKSALDREGGLGYRGSFYKNIGRRIHDLLVRTFEKVQVVADEHGTPEFMQSVPVYLERHLVRDLFSLQPFRFAKSHLEPLLQIADMISGSYARCVDPKRLSPRAGELLPLLQERSVGTATWPPRRMPTSTGHVPSPEGTHDELVRAHCRRQALLFLEDADRDDADQHVQALTLEHLIFQADFVDDRAFISTRDLLAHLNGQVREEVAEYRLRTVAIAPLRDSGVIIASSAKGYKLPVSASDLISFVNHANAIVPPMLARLKKARDALRLVSSGALDIVPEHDSPQLHRLLEALEPATR